MFDECDSGNSVVGDDTGNGYATGSYASDCDGFESGDTSHRSDGESEGGDSTSIIDRGDDMALERSTLMTRSQTFT